MGIHRLATSVALFLAIVCSIAVTTVGATDPIAALSGSFQTQAAGTISGVVNEPNGNAAAAWVELRTLDKKRAKDTTGQEISGVSSNVSQAGAFSFANVPDGSYLVQATVGSSSSSASSLETPVKLISGSQTPTTLVLRLTAIQFAGVVKNFDGSALMQQAGLKFTSSDKAVVHYTGTNDRGEFKVGALPISSAAGALTYSVEATPPYQTASVGSAPQAGITPGSSAALNITLNLGLVVVKGKVIMPTGTEVARDAEVILIPSNNVRIYSSTRQDGTFAFGNVTPGTYTLKINPPKALSGVTAPPEQSIVIVASQTKDVGTVRLLAAKKKIVVTIADEDGTKITNAKVQAVERGGQGFINTETPNIAGQFELSVGGGTWLVTALSKTASTGDDEWLFGGAPKPVEFTLDPATEQTSTLAFIVRKTELKKVVGKVCKVPCSTLNPELYDFVGVKIRIEDSNGFGNTVDSNRTGNYGMRLPKGNYRIKFFPPDTSWAPPLMVLDKDSKLVSLATFEIKVPSTDGNPIQIPTVVFSQKPASVTGSVKDANGNAVSGVPVNVWQKDGKDFGTTVTGTDGSYSLAVGLGSWFTAPAPTLASGYTFLDPPALVNVTASGAVAIPAFTLIVPAGTIEGSVVDSTTNANITNVRGMATATGRDGTKGSIQAPILDGKFTIKVPAGTFTVSVSFPPGSGYSPTATKPAELTTLTPSVTVVMPVAATNATISGALQVSGTTLTGVPASVYFDGGERKKEWTRVNPATGLYSLVVAPGTWFVRGYIDAENASYVVVNTTTNKVIAEAGRTATANLALLQAGGTISGTVKSATGAAISGARVWAVDSQRSGRDAVASITTEADANGAFTLKVPAGAYKVNAAANGNYLPPAPTTVIVLSSGLGSDSIALVFRALDGSITGVASIDGTPQANAFVRAYPSGGGGGRSATTDAHGAFSLSVTGGLTWNIQATAEKTASDKTLQAYRSAVIEVVVPAAGIKAQNLEMKVARTMPSPVSPSFDVTESQTMELADGTKVSVW